MITFTPSEIDVIKNIFTQYLNNQTGKNVYHITAEPATIDLLVNKEVIQILSFLETTVAVEITSFAKNYLFLCRLFVRFTDDIEHNHNALIAYFVNAYELGEN